MTSNIGGELKSDGLGFNPVGRDSETDGLLRQHFTPEFLGRVDNVVRFKPLDKQAMTQIAAKYLDQVRSRLSSNGFQLQLPEDSAFRIGDRATKKDGARQLRRLVREQVEGPLATFLLKNVKKPGKIKAVWEEEILKFYN